MTKTLWCANERTSTMAMPTYRKVTASKVEEIEEGAMNLYMDDKGNKYIVRYNKFQRRSEFVQIR